MRPTSSSIFDYAVTDNVGVGLGFSFFVCFLLLFGFLFIPLVPRRPASSLTGWSSTFLSRNDVTEFYRVFGFVVIEERLTSWTRLYRRDRSDYTFIKY